MVSRESLTKLLGLLMVLGVAGALPGAALPLDACGGNGLVGVNPVVNGGMTIGSEMEPTADGVVGETVQNLTGAGNLSAAHAYFGVAGWTIGVADQSRMPFSDAGWSDHHGRSGSGVAWVHYDARDTGNATVVLRQAIGDPAAGGVYCHADAVTLDLVSDGPVDVMVDVHTAERPDLPYSSGWVRVGLEGGHGNPGMPTGAPFEAPWALTDVVFDVDAVGTLTMVEIIIDDVGDGSSDGAWVFVDNAAVFGTSTVPVPL